MTGETQASHDTVASITWPEFLQSGQAAEDAKPFDVVVVGSGYGGSVAVHTLSRATKVGDVQPRVLLLERGRSFKPGDFPSRFAELPREMRVARQSTGSVSGHEGLFDLRLGDDVAALVANGLGGGSLINAGVMLDPDPDDVRSIDLAAHLRCLLGNRTFRRARRMLGGEVLRNGQWVRNHVGRLPEPPHKTGAYQRIAIHRATTAEPVDITVALDAEPNFGGHPLKACIHCGDCMTGCNHGAKDSLDRNLLWAAKQALGDNLVIVTGATVTSVVREGQRWDLRVLHTDADLQMREARAFRIGAPRVVLAAGTLGSPEILLRSRSDRTVFSSTLGQSFSGNGDDIAAIHRLPEEVLSSADEAVDPAQRQVGPTTTARVELQQHYGRKFLLEEFSVPGPMKRLFDEIVTTGYVIGQLPKRDSSRHAESDLDPLAVDEAAMRKTLLVGVIGHDDASGRLDLAQPFRPVGDVPQMGAIRIHWPQARWGREFDITHESLRRFAEHPINPPLGTPPTLVSNPMWRLLPAGLETLVTQPRGPVLTVHPLGGCRIGSSAADGVVDVCGRVFDADPRALGADDLPAVHEGLIVLDGSIVGASLGVNPALTISALALYASEWLCEHWGWTLAGLPASITPEVGAIEPPPPPPPPSPQRSPTAETPTAKPPPPPPLPVRTKLRVTERLWGHLTLDGRRWVAEFTFGFQPSTVSQLIGPARAPMHLNADGSTLRLYPLSSWKEHHLEAADEEVRAPFAAYVCALEGDLRFLHREASSGCQRTRRGLRAWFLNRGHRDLWDRFFEPLRNDALRAHRKALKAARPLPPNAPPQPGRLRRFLNEALEFANLASHNGQVRLFDYRLTIGTVTTADPGLATLLVRGAGVHGQKRLGYGRRVSPWTQLTEMGLVSMPGLAARTGPFKLDGRFLARQGTPLLEVASQRDHAEALAELLSFGLYMLRVLIDTHLWSFRKPDRVGLDLPGANRRGEPDRLPGALPNLLPPEITWLPVDRWPKDSPQEGEPVYVRLARYAQPVDKPPGEPVVLIHGYSASGTTFAHPSLKPSAVAQFHAAGRDVWVLDLRTSCGLPSALWPWAMEQVGAIDIPAALLHVHGATGRKVDVVAHCIGGAMLGFALLADEKLIRSGEQEFGVDAFLTTEQFGVLAAFNGAAPNGGPHPVVNSVVLSQKGPLMRYTDANVLRAFVLQYARRWLLPEHWSFRSSADPGVAEQLLDRLLSSLPYPKADFDAENPGQPCAKTAWTTTRHRLDALFGRVFTAANLRPETLDAIDDLFGPINLDTVAQTIHFARYDCITNQRGRGEFVTREQLRARWGGIPTLALHGVDNGLTDPHTAHLLHEVLQEAGVRVVPQVLPNTGHQDTWIGRGVSHTCEVVSHFWAHPPAVPAPPTSAWVIAWPWIGPRLVAPAKAEALPQVAVMSSPTLGDCSLWLLPVWAAANPAPGQPRYTLPPGAPHGWAHSEPASSLFWQFVQPLDAPDPWGPPVPGSVPGWVALTVYELDETIARKVPDPASPAPTDEPPVGAEQAREHAAAPQPRYRNGDDHFPVRDDGLIELASQAPLPAALRLQAAQAPVQPLFAARPAAEPERMTVAGAPPGLVDEVRRWLTTDAASASTGFVALADVWRTGALADAERQAAEPLHFALASCQYPSGLFDREAASASLAAMAAHGLKGGQPLALALMVGDQIYADATAGLTDPTRRDEKYDQPHQRAFRLEGMRRVMRRMPVQMLLDDHEIFDNWEPLPLNLNADVKRVEDEIKRRRKERRNGVAAYRLYQRMSDRRSAPSPLQSFDFEAGGHAFYMLDTRTCRQRGSPSGGPAGGYIVPGAEQSALEAWLVQHRDKVKFIASPSILLPRRLEVVDREANACRSDSWDGFPESMAWLLRFIADNSIRHVVFLSGDEHHSMHAAITLQGPMGSVKVASVHSSGLYAPYPFANGRPEDLALTENFPLAGMTVDVTTTRPATGGDGFAALHVTRGAAGPQLHIEYVKPGIAGQHYTLAL